MWKCPTCGREFRNTNVDFHNGLSRQTVIAPDGTDITETVETAVAWLTEHSF